MKNNAKVIIEGRAASIATLIYLAGESLDPSKIIIKPPIYIYEHESKPRVKKQYDDKSIK